MINNLSLPPGHPCPGGDMKSTLLTPHVSLTADNASPRDSVSPSAGSASGSENSIDGSLLYFGKYAVKEEFVLIPAWSLGTGAATALTSALANPFGLAPLAQAIYGGGCGRLVGAMLTDNHPTWSKGTKFMVQAASTLAGAVSLAQVGSRFGIWAAAATATAAVAAGTLYGIFSVDRHPAPENQPVSDS